MADRCVRHLGVERRGNVQESFRAVPDRSLSSSSRGDPGLRRGMGREVLHRLGVDAWYRHRAHHLRVRVHLVARDPLPDHDNGPPTLGRARQHLDQLPRGHVALVLRLHAYLPRLRHERPHLIRATGDGVFHGEGQLRVQPPVGAPASVRARHHLRRGNVLRRYLGGDLRLVHCPRLGECGARHFVRQLRRGPGHRGRPGHRVQLRKAPGNAVPLAGGMGLERGALGTAHAPPHGGDAYHRPVEETAARALRPATPAALLHSLGPAVEVGE
mmetsp:Transcript_89807/g.258884  ORF Transcript_89807/g.258884 Transcript_89807/m.258884 type:complete len:271 (+) Transcript_89807:1575-2387(+)